MASFPERSCMRCGGASQFQTRISLPPQAVYRCMSCGYNTWVPLRAGDIEMPPPGPAPTDAVVHMQQQSSADEDQQAAQAASPKATDEA